MPLAPRSWRVNAVVTTFLKLARRLLHPRRARAPQQVAGSAVCAICGGELLPAQARYRLDEGPVHKACYQRITRLPPPVA